MNDNGSTVETIRRIAQRVVSDRGLELVDVQVSGGGRGGAVQVFVDRPGGVRVDDLQSVSEEVSAVLDVEDPIQGRYTLEVSSPGLDRPLRAKADFLRVVGQSLHVATLEPIAGRSEWTGRLLSVDDAGALTLEAQAAAGFAPLRVPLALIARARLEIAIPQMPRRARDRKRKKARKAHG